MPAPLSHRRATPADAALLAAMNKELIDDEGHRNPMTVGELETRMRDWIAGEYVATIFEQGSRIVAYALWREEPEWVYLRQFFVDRAFRRQGIGHQAIRLLTDEVWPPGKRVRVEVLIGNQKGLAFWQSVGFADYALTLEMERHE